MVGIKPEVVQRSKSDCISVLILRKGLAVPSDGTGVLSCSPRCAAIALVVKRTVICPARLLRWRVKSDIADVHAGSKRHAKRLDRSIEVLIIQGVLVVPDSRSWISHLIAHKPDPIVPRIGLVLI